MSPKDLFILAGQLAVPLAMILGLWIAARWLPDVTTWLSRSGAESFVSRRAGQLIVWIGLGVIFGSPLADWLGLVGVAAQLLLGPAVNTGMMSTVWGQIPFWLYSEINILMTLVIYALVLWVGYRLWPEAGEGEGDGNTSLALEEWFVLLAAGSLVNRFVQSIVLSIIWLPLSNAAEMGRLLPVGYLGAWLLGLAIVAVVLLVLLNRLRKTETPAK